MTYYEVDNILAILDGDNSGKIAFDEFMMPAIDPFAVISDNDKTFRMLRQFDVTKRGSLIIRELEMGLKPKKPIKEYIWRQLMSLHDPKDDIWTVQVGQD